MTDPSWATVLQCFFPWRVVSLAAAAAEPPGARRVAESAGIPWNPCLESEMRVSYKVVPQFVNAFSWFISTISRLG